MTIKNANVGHKAIEALAKPRSGVAKTVVSFLLDETGSMAGVAGETIAGFNEFVVALQDAGRKHGGVIFSLTKFNSEKTKIVHSAVPIEDIGKLNAENYVPQASTPLYDAIGTAISDMDRALASETGKVNVLVVILTDGEENDSREFDRAKIFRLIEARKKQGWTFVFLGADQDAYAAAADMGVHASHTMSYASMNTRAMWKGLSAATNRHVRDGFEKVKDEFFSAGDLNKAGAQKPKTKKGSDAA